MNEFNEIPTRIDIDAPDRADWKRDVLFHVGAWATWDDKTPVVRGDDFTELPTREIPAVRRDGWLARIRRLIGGK